LTLRFLGKFTSQPSQPNQTGTVICLVWHEAWESYSSINFRKVSSTAMLKILIGMRTLSGHHTCTTSWNSRFQPFLFNIIKTKKK